MQYPLFRYIRDKNKQPYGVVVIDKDERLGWSICSPRDVWNRNGSKSIALDRMMKHGCQVREIIDEYISYVDNGTSDFATIREILLNTLYNNKIGLYLLNASHSFRTREAIRNMALMLLRKREKEGTNG